MTSDASSGQAGTQHVVVVGNGMASLRFVEELTRRAPVGRFRITVIGAEPEPAYNRVLLSSRLAGEVDDAGVAMRSRGWYAVRGVSLVTGTSVTAIDRAARTVTLSCGEALGYDRLVLATGSDPVRLPLPGADRPEVATFRDMADVARMEALEPGARAVVIGGGLLGIEAAWGLKRRGVDVTLVHVLDRLMERQLDGAAASELKKAIEARGIRVLLDSTSERVDSTSPPTLILNRKMRSDVGETLTRPVSLPFDLLVMAVGIRPRVTLGKDAGLAVGRGILVDDRMTTSDPAIHAIGECCEHAGLVAGLVEPAYAQALVLARTFVGEPAAYRATAVATNLKVSGVPVFSCGRHETEAGDEEIRVVDPELGLYRKLLVREGRLVGCVLVGDTADGLFYLDLVASGRPVAAIRSSLAFGRAHCEAA